MTLLDVITREFYFNNAFEATVDGQLPLKENIRVGSTPTKRTKMKIKYKDGTYGYVDEHDFKSEDVDHDTFRRVYYQGKEVSYIMDDDYDEEDDY